MSKQNIAEITCFKCGHTFEHLIYTSVNSKLNPELRSQILEGSFFNFTCESCGKIIDSYYPVLYHDLDKKFMIWLVKPDEKNRIYMRINSLKVPNFLIGYRLHISRYPFQWAERIRTLELGMDPRIMELYKFSIKQSENLPLVTNNDFLFFKKYTRNALGRTTFHYDFINDDEIEEYAKPIMTEKYEGYEKLVKSLEPHLMSNSWYLVDWQFPFGEKIIDGEYKQLPEKSEIIQVGEQRTEFPKHFIDVVIRTDKGEIKDEP